MVKSGPGGALTVLVQVAYVVQMLVQAVAL